MVLRADAPLYGPPPATLLDPVPHGDLRRAIAAGVPGLLEGLESDTRNVLLTLARVWSTLVTGDIRSKDAAADWALGRLPAGDRPPLAHARAVYLGQEAEDWSGRGVRSCADRLVREIRAAYGAGE
jgi:streptomycin 3"-adenylyltransferase